jgi:NTE family protein
MTATPGDAANPRADLVLEGGGVKGIGLVGAVDRLVAAGYTFPRIAGTSAGAVVGAVIVGLQRAGEPLSRLIDVASTLDYRKLRDRGPIGRLTGPLARVVDRMSQAFESGIYEGEYLHDWVDGVLRDLGIETFGDIRTDDPDSSLPPEYRYDLVVVASDLSRQRMVRLPWDYEVYGLDADERRISDAVRASASIPFYYEPVTLRSPLDKGVSTLVDGGVLSNFPIALFDRTDDNPPRWPTFGVRLSARPTGRVQTQAVNGPVSLALALVETMMDACDARHIDDPCVQARSIFVDTSGISSVDFTLTKEQRQLLLDAGIAAADDFLSTWDWASYLRSCRGVRA